MTPDEDKKAVDTGGFEVQSDQDLPAGIAPEQEPQIAPETSPEHATPVGQEDSNQSGNLRLNEDGLTGRDSADKRRTTSTDRRERLTDQFSGVKRKDGSASHPPRSQAGADLTDVLSAYSIGNPGMEAADSPGQRSRRAVRYARLSFIQKVIVVGVVVVASMLVYVLLKSPVKPVAGASQVNADPVERTARQPRAPQPAVADSSQVEEQQGEEPMLAVFPARPRSIEAARRFYRQGDYRRAYSTYELLLPALPAGDHLLRDYLQLEMALCAKRAEDWAQASRMLASVCQSGSLPVRVIANYQLGLLEIQRKRFLTAGTRAYNALALVRAVGFDDSWASSFESDCHFLIAECLSRRVLLLSNVDANLPGDLWGKPNTSGRPFDAFDGVELRRFLNSGSDRMDEALLEPLIRRVEYPSEPPRWSVISSGAPLEELLGKFAGVAGLDVHWALKAAPDLNSAHEAGRQRAVTLYLPAATSRQVVLTAVGCAGLLACVQDDPNGLAVTIYDPTEYSSLDGYLSLIGQQAISLWQTFILTFYEDKRLGNAHFVTGLLQSRMGQPTQALAEYKLVANRFSQTTLAAYALLRSGNLKSALRDYQGARGDLKQLIEQYPETEIYEQAYWHLADATMKAGLNAEAARLYQVVHDSGFSPELKTLAALRAARCFYETKAYEDAARWLTRYIGLVGPGRGSNLYSAWVQLGQTNLALGKYEQACEAFQHVLVETSPRGQYVEAVAALVRSHIEQEHFVEALNTLEYLHSVTLSEKQSVEMLLLKSKISRFLGLVDAAMVSLQDGEGYVSDEQLGAKISFELALCQIAKGDLEHARSRLSEILSVAEPGPLAQEAALALSDVCVKLDQDAQAVSVCLKLLDSNPPPETEHNALKTLAVAYEEQKEYDKAALALSGRWKQE
jgi:tetratricopeptide (TPR) repeat protein